MLEYSTKVSVSRMTWIYMIFFDPKVRYSIIVVQICCRTNINQLQPRVFIIRWNHPNLVILFRQTGIPL